MMKTLKTIFDRLFRIRDEIGVEFHPLAHHFMIKNY